MVKKSLIIIGGCATAMVAAVALAGATPALFSLTPLGSSASPPAATQSPAPGRAGRFFLASSQYGPVPAQFDAIPLGEGQVAVAGVPPTVIVRAAPIVPRVNAEAATPDGAPTQVAGGPEDRVGCTLNANGQRVGISLDLLVNTIKTDVNRMAAQAPIDTIRTLIQDELNRSGDDPKVKTEALELLRTAYTAQTIPGQALARPFNLYDTGLANVPGYDPCGNPAATGGSAFGTGPFASDFSTINPVPVIASRLAAAAEGGI